MSLVPKYSAARRAGMLNTLTSSASSGILRIYSGSQPADADASIGAGTVLAELTMNATAFGAATSTASTDSVLTANAIVSDSDANATGTAAWFRLWDSAGTTPLFDGTVGTSASFNLNINSTAIQIHAAVSVSAMTVTLPV